MAHHEPSRAALEGIMGRYGYILAIALFLGVAATGLLYKSFQGARKPVVSTVRIVVASADIPAGQSVGATEVKMVNWPKSTLPPQYFTGTDSIVGRTTKAQIFAGDPITASRLAPKGAGPGLEVHIPTGYRAMAVRINDVAGLSGLIQPASRVDVVVTMKSSGDPTAPQVSKLFMENLEVLSVGDHTDRETDGKPISATTVTLAVTPAEAERLALASDAGVLQLILRGYGENGETNTPGATSHDVLGAAPIKNPYTSPDAPPAQPHAVSRSSHSSATPRQGIIAITDSGRAPQIQVWRHGRPTVSMQVSHEAPVRPNPTVLQNTPRGTYYINGSNGTSSNIQ